MNWVAARLIFVFLGALTLAGCIPPPPAPLPPPSPAKPSPAPRVVKRPKKPVPSPSPSTMSLPERERLYLRFLQWQLDKQREAAQILGLDR